MKYVGIFVILAIIPLFYSLLRSGRSGRTACAFILGLSPFFVQSAHIIVAPVSWPYWPGYVKGFEISLIDSLAVAIVCALPRARAAANYVAPFLLLAGLAVLSAPGTPAPTAALFVAWQVLRVLLVLVAASRLAVDRETIRAMVGGMVFGLGCNAIAAAVQHLQGVYQAPGLFDHQNKLGLAAHFVALPATALFVAEPRAKWTLLGLLSAGAVAIFGASRATIGLEAAGVGLMIITIAIAWPSPRGFALLAVGAIGLAAATPLAFTALAPRFAAAATSDYDERKAFEETALAMLHDQPGGVGANHYVIVANVRGYSDRSRVAAALGSRSANVHNAYLLTATEMGWAALVPFLWLSVVTALHGIYWAFRSRDRQLSIVLFGCSAAQAVVAVHNIFEWVFVTYTVQVIFCLNLGMIAVMIGRARTASRLARASHSQDDQAAAVPAGTMPAHRSIKPDVIFTEPAADFGR